MITDLMRQSVTLKRVATETRDAIGGVTVATTSNITVDAYLEPLTQSDNREDLANRNTQIGEWRLFLPAGTDIDGWDTVVHGGRTFEITAPPRPMFNPVMGEVSHIEVDLTEVK